MLAPNLVKTSFSEKLWLFTKTKQFKMFFGDFEKNFQITQQMNKKSLYIGTSSVPFIDEKGNLYLTKKGQNYECYFSLINAFYKIFSQNKEVFFLIQVIESSIKDETDLPIGDYNEFLKEDEKMGILKDELFKVPKGSYLIEQYNDNKLFRKWGGFYNKEVSRVVSKNGEPLICYRNTSLIKTFEEDYKEAKNIFFTDNKDYVEGFRNKNTLSFFLNIKNPIDLSERDKEGFPKIGLHSGNCQSYFDKDKNKDGIIGHDALLDADHINWKGTEYIVKNINQVIQVEK